MNDPFDWIAGFQTCLASPPIATLLPTIAIANPPYGTVKGSDYPDFDLAHKWKKIESDGKSHFEKLDRGYTPNVALEGLFIERMISAVPDGSVVATLVPNGLLSTSGNEYARAWMQSRCQIVSSIQLPSTMWLIECDLSLTTSVLILRKTDPPADCSVFFGMGEDCGFSTRGNPQFNRDQYLWNVLDDDLPCLSQEFEKFLWSKPEPTAERLDDGFPIEWRLCQIGKFVQTLEAEIEFYSKPRKVWNGHYKRFIKIKRDRPRMEIRQERVNALVDRAKREASVHGMTIETAVPWVITPESRDYCNVLPVAIGQQLKYEGVDVTILKFVPGDLVTGDFRTKILIAHPRRYRLTVWLHDLLLPIDPLDLETRASRFYRALVLQRNDDGEFAEIEHRYWWLRQACLDSTVEMQLMTIRSILNKSIEQEADGWIDRDIKKQLPKLRRNSAQYRQLRADHWGQALLSAQVYLESERVRALELLKIKQQEVHQKADYMLNVVIEMESILRRLSEVKPLRHFDQNYWDAAATVRRKVIKYLGIYLPQIEALRLQAVTPIVIESAVAAELTNPLGSPKDFGILTRLQKPANPDDGLGLWLIDSRFVPNVKQPLLVGRLKKTTRGWVAALRDASFENKSTAHRTRAAAALDLLYGWTESRSPLLRQGLEVLEHATEQATREQETLENPVRAWLEAEAWTRLNYQAADWLLIMMMSIPVPAIDWLAERLEPLIDAYNAATFRSQVEKVVFSVDQNAIALKNPWKEIRLTVDPDARSYRITSQGGPFKTEDLVNLSFHDLERLLFYWQYLPGRDPLGPVQEPQVCEGLQPHVANRDTPPYRVLSTAAWDIHAGGGGGIVGQLTKIDIAGRVAYVRENVRYDSFLVSATGRLAMKMRGQLPPDAQQVLELAAQPDQWSNIADLVEQVEAGQGFARPVVKNSQFTIAWADRQLSKL